MINSFPPSPVYPVLKHQFGPRDLPFISKKPPGTLYTSAYAERRLAVPEESSSCRRLVTLPGEGAQFIEASP